MRLRHPLISLGVLAALFCQNSCTMDPYIITAEEEYTRNFIKQFGIIDSQQNWNMAVAAEVAVSLGDTELASVKIYCRYGEKYYLVANLENVKGIINVPVDVPQSCDDILVRVNHRTDFFGKIGQTIDCTGRSKISRASSIDQNEGKFVYDPSHPNFDFNTSVSRYDAEYFGISVTPDPDPTKYPDGYVYFNAQQMGPVVNGDTKNGWPDYVSLSRKELIRNTDKSLGILPEIGTANMTDGNTRNLGNYYSGDHLARLQAAQTACELRQDFTYSTPDGEFDIFPMFYGSNQVHVVGIYFIDPHTGEPLYGADNDGDGHPDLIKFPIFETKHNDDIQLKLIDGSEDDIMYYRLGRQVFSKITGDDSYPTWPLELTVGHTCALDFSAVTFGGKKLSNEEVTPKLSIVDTPDACTLTTANNIITVTAQKATDGAVYPKFRVTDTDLGVAIRLVVKEAPVVTDESYYLTIVDPTDENRMLKTKGGDDAAIDYTSNDINLNVDDVLKIYPKVYKDGQEIGYDSWSENVEFEEYYPSKCPLEIDQENKCIKITAKEEMADTYFPKIKIKSNGNRIGLRIKIGSVSSQSAKKRGISRADEDYTRATENGGNLYHDTQTKWVNINQIYHNGSSDSYSTQTERLVRSRGYHVKLTHGASKQPWTGQFGVYIDYKWNPDEMEDGSVTSGARPISGSHYSQMELNTGADHLSNYKYYNGNTTERDKYMARWAELKIPSNATFRYSYAATFKHPYSNRQFFSFEDWPVTHPGPSDQDLSHKYTGWDYDTNGFNWGSNTGEYSSDRDCNDIVFFIEGIDKVEGKDDITKWEDEDVRVEENGFSWIWAVEDLGATDDFDFNDVVVKITSITEIKTTTTKTEYEDKDGNITTKPGTPTVTTTEVKKVVLQPLAAGGTLPLYINWTAKDGTTYCLSPGSYYQGAQLPDYVGKTENAEPLSKFVGAKSGMEIHGWFGYPSN